MIFFHRFPLIPQTFFIINFHSLYFHVYFHVSLQSTCKLASTSVEASNYCHGTCHRTFHGTLYMVQILYGSFPLLHYHGSETNILRPSMEADENFHELPFTTVGAIGRSDSQCGTSSTHNPSLNISPPERGAPTLIFDFPSNIAFTSTLPENVTIYYSVGGVMPSRA